MLTEYFLHNAYGNGTIPAHQVICQPDSTIINDGGGFSGSIEVIEYGEVVTGNLLQQITLIGQQHDHALFFRPFLQFINLPDCIGIGGIASYSPDGVCRIQDEPPCL